MMKKVTLLCVMTVLVSVLCIRCWCENYQPPPIINYQVYLSGVDQKPLEGLHRLRFSLYHNSSAGEAFWNEIHNVTATNGIVSVYLGTGTDPDGNDPIPHPPLDASFFSKGRLYLGLSVDGGPEFNIRQEFSSAPYALVSEYACNGNPPGTVIQYAGAVPPMGWLLCDGTSVNRAQYPALFSAIGTTYGSGDGQTTFNLPDLRGRFALGRENMGEAAPPGRVRDPEGKDLGAAAGRDRVSLSIAQIPTHKHNGSTDSPDTSSDFSNRFFKSGSDTTGYVIQQGGVVDVRADSNWWHSHSFETNSVGNNEEHENMPPYMTLNYLIKY